MTHSMGAKARDRCTPLAVDCAHCAQFPMHRRRRPQVDGSMGRWTSVLHLGIVKRTPRDIQAISNKIGSQFLKSRALRLVGMCFHELV